MKDKLNNRQLLIIAVWFAGIVLIFWPLTGFLEAIIKASTIAFLALGFMGLTEDYL